MNSYNMGCPRYASTNPFATRTVSAETSRSAIDGLCHIARVSRAQRRRRDVQAPAGIIAALLWRGRQRARLSRILDLLAEDSRLNVYAGELDVRPPLAGYPAALSPIGGRFLFDDRKSSLSITVERPADEVIH